MSPKAPISMEGKSITHLVEELSSNTPDRYFSHYNRNTFVIPYAVDENGESTCSDDVRRCSGSPGESIVKELASNNDQFVEEFIDVFTKMI